MSCIIKHSVPEVCGDDCPVVQSKIVPWVTSDPLPCCWRRYPADSLIPSPADRSCRTGERSPARAPARRPGAWRASLRCAACGAQPRCCASGAEQALPCLAPAAAGLLSSALEAPPLLRRRRRRSVAAATTLRGLGGSRAPAGRRPPPTCCRARTPPRPHGGARLRREPAARVCARRALGHRPAREN